MRKVIIVQARMGSKRLHGKILKVVLNKPLLEYQIERLRRVKLVDEIAVATTIHETDNPIVDLCEKLSVSYFRGSEEDVLARYYGVAKDLKADVVIRITSDCPIIDPQVIDKTVQFYLDHHGEYDYVSNTLTRSYPRGMDTEVFSFKVLDETFNEATDQPDREHVTPFIYRHSQRYRLANVSHHEDQSRHRWTVDTQEDFNLITRIIEGLYPLKPEFCLEDVLSLFEEKPNLFLINAHIEQKKLGQ